MKQTSLVIRMHRRSDGADFEANRITIFSNREVEPSLQDRLDEARMYEGSPPNVVELSDVYHIPRFVSLYDKHGCRIPETCLRRGPGLAEFAGSVPETVEVPSDCVTIEEPVLYLSWLPNHWGHFLTESLSRLWARLEIPEFRDMAGFYCRAETNSAFDQVLESFGFAFGHNLLSSEGRPIRFKTCFVPEPSYANRGQAYSVHREVAQHFVRSQGYTRWDASAQPVYLSRTRFAKGQIRTIRGELELEDRLRRSGFLIVHPETLSLDEQVALFNRHDRFVGCWGSAFHTAVFRLEPNFSTSMLCDELPKTRFVNTNYTMFDGLTRHTADYIDCMSDVPGTERVWPRLDLQLDLDCFADYARERLGMVIQD